MQKKFHLRSNFPCTWTSDTAIPKIKLNITIDTSRIARNPMICDVIGKYCALENVFKSAPARFGMVTLIPNLSLNVM